MLNFLLKSGQMVGSWVAKPISIWRGKLVGWAGFASWPRFAGYSMFAGCARLTSCARFTSYSRFTRLSSYTSPTGPACSSAGVAIFSPFHSFTFSPFHMPFTFLR